jgi:general secretion pathway protein B
VSSILKALKKLEQEKVVRGERPVNLAVDIHRGARRRRQNLLIPAAWVLLGMGLAAGVIWLVRAPGPPRAPAVALAPAPTPVSPQAPNAPQLPVPATPIESGPVSSLPSVLHDSPTVGAVGRGILAPPRPAPIPADNQPARPDKKPGGSGRGEEGKMGSRHPSLQLTGIVWQDDAASRMAIINDLPVMVGTVIEGAKVVEIHPDRVVLTADGKKTELLLPP